MLKMCYLCIVSGARRDFYSPSAPSKTDLSMKPITSSAIDKVIDELDQISDEQYEEIMEQFTANQPVLIAYIFNDENFHLLNEDERGYLEYLALILWRSVHNAYGPLQPVSEEAIGEAEEKNYEIMENSTGKHFSDRLNPFFEGYPQEDLLAFAEEAVTEDEDEPEGIIGKEAREPIFVALKTMIDVLTASNTPT